MSHADHIPHDAPAPPAFDAALWSRLEAMQLDAPDASLTFSRRLARENGWSVARAREVVAEYRRFLYLAARAGHPVTPSDAVDQAWHLHLVYTRHYWGVLCREVLGFELHHGPTLGGQRERAKSATGIGARWTAIVPRSASRRPASGPASQTASKRSSACSVSTSARAG